MTRSARATDSPCASGVRARLCASQWRSRQLARSPSDAPRRGDLRTKIEPTRRASARHSPPRARVRMLPQLGHSRLARRAFLSH
jgi:hypothetical protein